MRGAYLCVMAMGEPVAVVAGRYRPPLATSKGSAHVTSDGRQGAMGNLVRRARLGEKVRLVCFCTRGDCSADFLLWELTARVSGRYE